MNDRIYLDHAAATPLNPEVKKVIDQAETAWANASSLHQEGREARAIVDKARLEAANFLGVETDEIIFTGSATESNIMALLGVVNYKISKGEQPHIVINRLEHASIIEPVKQMESRGAEVTWLNVDAQGFVDKDQMVSAIKDNTVFVSVIFANNETGVVNDVTGLVRAAKQKNPRLVFHTDAAQAVGWIDFKIKDIGVDLMSVSSYKLAGPKGVGLLYIKSGLEFWPTFPGTQEWGKRGGTEPVSLIAGLAKALTLTADWPKAEVGRLRDMLITKIVENVKGVQVNTVREHSVPHIAHFSFAGVDAQILTIALDRAGLAASPGSACSSGAVESSHVVEAMGIDLEKYPGSLRLSLSTATTEQEILRAAEIVQQTIAELRNRS